MPDNHEKARLERDQRIRQTVWAYKRVFASPDGKAILEDLRKSFGMDMPVFLPTGTRVGGNISFDNAYAAKRDGQQDIWRHIHNAVNSPLEPDGNLDEPFEVITGVRG